MKRVMALMLLVGCGGGGQTPQCKQYVDCVAKLAGSSASVESTYGVDGSCWADQKTSDDCTKKCKAAVAAFVGQDAGC